MNEPQTNTGVSKSAVQRLVMPAAMGVVRYDVLTECPHCGKKLALNQYPYDDADGEYGHTEDRLGLAVFGTETEPAKWTGLSIEYACCGCHKQFQLAKLEI